MGSNQYTLPVLTYLMWTQIWPIANIQQLDREGRKIIVENAVTDGKEVLAKKVKAIYKARQHEMQSMVSEERWQGKLRWRRGGAVVRALTSHQCGPGSISGPGVIHCMWVEFVVGSLLAPRGFSPGTPVFPSPQNQHCQIQIRSGMHRHMLNKLLSTLNVFRG